MEKVPTSVLDDDQDLDSGVDEAPDIDDLDQDVETEEDETGTDTDVDEDASPDAGEVDLAAELEKYKRRAAEYEKRFKNLQPVVQKRVEENRQLMMQKLQLEQQLAQLQAAQQISQLPEEEQAHAWQMWQMQNQLQQQAMVLQHAYQAMNNEAKVFVAEKLARQYRVPAERLMRYDTFEAMKQAAIDIADERRKLRKAQRKQRKADTFGAGFSAGPANPPKKPQTFEEIREALRQNYRWVTS